jgi:aryl-alcohol dehydrogenase-like predicted oxidoreductase
VKAFCNLAGKIGLKPAVLAIAWCLKNPHVSTVILGASKVHQLEENLQASAAATEQLTPDLLDRIEQIMGTKSPKPDDSDDD